ncbi:hypothetical protein BDD14_0897 [Edaphobacter modestus]|uniref:Uncharacterized protein n=1 Tax=Edaphobacter modestus TaxID=388466 RepID=A0A4Q7YP26_9BACT|nr:hypothetical protein BDD14_0897 [Edaphobacter modestus]
MGWHRTGRNDITGMRPHFGSFSFSVFLSFFLLHTSPPSEQPDYKEHFVSYGQGNARRQPVYMSTGPCKPWGGLQTVGRQLLECIGSGDQQECWNRNRLGKVWYCRR